MATPRLRLGVEALEARDCPTTASLSNGVLTVQGTDAGDDIQVVRSGNWIGASGQWFEAGAIRQLVITAGGGADTVRDDSGLSAIIYGGAGNDRIYGGRGYDLIYGGAGDDVIVGGRGADAIWGGGGNDTIAGGAGANVVNYGSPNVARGNTALEREVIDLVNANRAAYGLRPLTVSGRLNAAAALHSEDMMAIGSQYGPLTGMQHLLLGTSRPAISDRLDAVGYDGWTRLLRYGENIACGYATAAEIVGAWMSSSAHRENILDPGFTETGVSIRVDTVGQLYITQDFGRLV